MVADLSTCPHGRWNKSDITVDSIKNVINMNTTPYVLSSGISVEVDLSANQKRESSLAFAERSTVLEPACSRRWRATRNVVRFRFFEPASTHPCSLVLDLGLVVIVILYGNDGTGRLLKPIGT